MPSMSYCRFENTYGDLCACLDALNEGEALSDVERRYAKLMLDAMRDFLDQNDLVENWDESRANDLLENLGED